MGYFVIRTNVHRRPAANGSPRPHRPRFFCFLPRHRERGPRPWAPRKPGAVHREPPEAKGPSWSWAKYSPNAGSRVARIGLLVAEMLVGQRAVPRQPRQGLMGDCLWPGIWRRRIQRPTGCSTSRPACRARRASRQLWRRPGRRFRRSRGSSFADPVSPSLRRR